MNTGKRVVDFLIVGAQKSGTTSLYRYLSAHPEIYMPPGKELSFFSDPEKLAKGIDYYIDNYFADAPGNTILGEASPQYMSSDAVAPTIADAFPAVKIIAILRNPVTRAYSHYRMAVRRQIESRPFDRCINEMLQANPATDVEPDMESDFLRLGEYGRILLAYLSRFRRDQIKIVFVEELGEDPVGVLTDIFQFLGVDPGFRSEIIGNRFNEGGERRFSWLERLSEATWLRSMARAVLPADMRRALGYWFITEVVVKPEKGAGPDEATRQRLVNFFRSDVDLLEKQFGVSHPWHEFRTRDPGRHGN